MILCFNQLMPCILLVDLDVDWKNKVIKGIDGFYRKCSYCGHYHFYHEPTKFGGSPHSKGV